MLFFLQGLRGDAIVRTLATSLTATLPTLATAPIRGVKLKLDTADPVSSFDLFRTSRSEIMRGIPGAKECSSSNHILCSVEAGLGMCCFPRSLVQSERMQDITALLAGRERVTSRCLRPFRFHSQPCTPHVVYGCILIHPDLKLKEEKGPRTTGSPKTRTLATLVLLKKGANREWIRFGLVRDASSGAEASRFKREAQALLSKSCAL